MTDPTTTNTLIGQAAAILLALATLIGVIVNGLLSWWTKILAARNGVKSDEIHTLVNGGLAKLKADLALANSALVHSSTMLADANQRIMDLQQQVIALTTKAST